MYLTGFRSDMEGRKARRVASACRERGLASFRFDHRGHGASGGALESGSVGVWFRDALALLRARLRGEIVLVGASMGVWLMLLLARASGCGKVGRVRGLVGIGGGADFADRLPALTAVERRELRRSGIVWRPSRYGDGPYPLTERMVEDGVDGTGFSRSDGTPAVRSVCCTACGTPTCRGRSPSRSLNRSAAAPPG